MMLELKDLDVFYDQSQVLRGVSLRVEAGEIVCLIGRNGVGKSTTMKAIVGLVRARGGAISFKGQNMLGLPTHRVARAGLGYVPEDRRVFGGLTVLQNLRVAMNPSRSGRPWTLSDIYEIFPVLEQRRGQLAGSLSGGSRADR
jgi:branched-chain amino acid transport system ATP-binding protein